MEFFPLNVAGTLSTVFFVAEAHQLQTEPWLGPVFLQPPHKEAWLSKNVTVFFGNVSPADLNQFHTTDAN